MKKIISLALIVCMLLSIALPLSVSAEAASIEIDKTAAEAYWTDAKSGQFIVNADAKVYEISTAEQLLGLSLAMEKYSNDQAWTEGKTFKLTADIDLNPGVDWTAYKAAQLAGTAYSGAVTPVNEWRTLDNFYGSFDGDGHTISGIWTTNSDSQTGDVTHYGVFGGSVYPCLQEDGSYSNSIKDIVLDNGYIKGGSGSNKGLGGVVGVMRMVADGCSYTLENITVGSNYTVDGRSKPLSGVQIGGVAIGWYYVVKQGSMAINYDNVTFAGHVEGSTLVTSYDGVFAGIWRYKEESNNVIFNVSMNDCVFSGTKNNTNRDEFTNSGTTATNCRTTALTPIDTTAAAAYWTDATTGQFIVNADAEVYEISTAEQLLGLSLAMENNSNDQAWTEGKTFKLTADIDLNPGVDWAAYKAAQLAGTTYAGVAPVNRWLSLDDFYGSIDGQGHTINGLWTDNSDFKAGNTAHYAVFGGSMYPCQQEDGTYSNSIKNIVLDNGYIKNGGKNGRGIAGVAGVIRMLAQDNCSYTLENIYIGENYTVDGRTTQTSNIQIGGVAIGWYNTGNSTNSMPIIYNNVVFAGHVEGSTAVTSYDGVFAGIWRYNEASGAAKFDIRMNDCVFSGTKNNTNRPEFTNTGTTATNCFVNDELQSIPEGLEGKYIETANGVMPVAVADMMSKYAYQATKADADGLYSVRLIGEVASMAYESVDFKVTITRASDGKSAVWGHNVEGYENAEKVYASVMANGEEKTAATMNDILDGEDNKLYVMTLNGLDTDETYTLSVTTVWTLLDGTTVEGVSVKTVTPAAWVEA